MNKLFFVAAVVLALVGCNKDEPAVQPGSSGDSDAAMHKFLDRKAKKVRTIAEIEAEEKAKEAAAKGAQNGTQK